MLRRLLAIVAAGAVVASLAGCGGSGSAESADTLRVVASTNVYGDIAATIGGSHVAVTSIIDDPSRDPHEYQADARTQLAISKARVVIENGGGYDDFVGTMLKASKNSRAVVVDAVRTSGFTGRDMNEHVWYDAATMSKVVEAVAEALRTADPAHASDYSRNATALQAGITTLQSDEQGLAATTAGAGAAITEPVPNYLLEALQMDIVTPPAFSKAIEDGTDVPPAVLQQTLAQFSDGTVRVLVYNVQAGGPQTDQVLAAAKRNGVPAVPVSETMPAGMHYVQWQRGVVASIAQAVKG